jgi:ASCH domain
VRQPFKILSIRQPWATLIVQGTKDIENRSWATSYRGPVLVHASSSRPSRRLLADVAGRFGVDLQQVELPVGGVIGVTQIIDCVDAHPSPWFEGEFGFVLNGSCAVPFVPWKGSLGLCTAAAALVDACGIALDWNVGPSF